MVQRISSWLSRCRTRRAAWAAGGCAALGAALVALAQPSSEYRAYPLRHQTPGQVKRLLAEVLPDQDQLQIIADEERGQVLLRGPERAQQVAQELIKKIDRPRASAPETPEVRAYPLADDRLESTAVAVRRQFAGQAQVRVASDRQSGQLLVVAPPQVHRQIAESLAAAAETAAPRIASPAAPAPDVLLSLEHSRADQLEPLLAELLAARWRPHGAATAERAEYRVHGPQQRSVAVTFERQQGTVRVSGPEPLAGQVVRLVRTLDSPRQPAGHTVQVVPLRRARAGTVQGALDAYRGTRPAQPEPAADDQSARRVPRPIQRVFFLQPAAAPAEAAASDLPAADDEAATRREKLRALGADLELETLPDLDVIILRGNERDVNDMLRIIQEIERLSVEAEPQAEVVRLKNVGSEQLAALLAPVVQELIAGRQGRVTVTPLVKPNALLVVGWGEALRSVQQLVAKLDQPVAPETQFRVFALRHAPAAATGATVQEFFSQRTGLGPKMLVTPDVRSNALLVQASPRDMAEAALMIQRLDTPRSEAVNQVRLFRLKNTLAADLAETLQAAIEVARGGPAASPAAAPRSAVIELLTVDAEGEKLLKSGILNDVKVTPDPRANTLLVTAPAESMELVAALIGQLDESPASTAQIKVFRIVHGDAAGLVQMLRALLPAPAAGSAAANPRLAAAEGEASLAPLRFSIDARTNSIIATGSAGDLNIIEALLLRLDEKDVKQRQNAVYRLKNAPAIDVALAINEFLRSERQVQQAAPGSGNPFQQIESEVIVVPEPVSNGLIISATPRFFDDIRQLVEQIDSQPQQVLIQVLIGEVALNNADEFGVELGIQDSLLFDRSLLGDLVTTNTTTTFGDPPTTVQQQTIVAATNTPGFNFNNQSLGNSGSDQALARSNKVAGQALSSFAVGRINNELGYGGMVLSASSESVSVLIRALQETRRMEVLARPQVMTLDNQPAFIQVGQRVPRVIGTTINQVGQVNNIALENVGLILGVTPRISPEGKVVMEIDAEKSELGAEAEGIPVSISATGEVIRSPRINIATAQTTVSAADGETIVLGGLITRNRSEVRRRVPWLANIPVLGHLFRYDGSFGRRTELLIILTPHVVRSAEDLDRLKQAEAAKMSWCAADLHSIHGPTGICRKIDCPICTADIPIVYPDRSPRGIEEVTPPAGEAEGPGLNVPGNVPEGAAPPQPLSPGFSARGEPTPAASPGDVLPRRPVTILKPPPTATGPADVPRRAVYESAVPSGATSPLPPR